MPLNGLRWSRDSGSALYIIPQIVVLGRAGGVTAQETANPPILFTTSEDGKTLTISGQGDLTKDDESSVIASSI